MILEQGLHRKPRLDVDKNARELVAAGWRVFVLPDDINDKKSFFDGIRRVIPLDPPVRGDRSWEALSDSLWGGLDSLNSNRIAIIWPGSTGMANAHREDFEIATSTLSELTKSLADSDATMGNTKRVLVILS